MKTTNVKHYNIDDIAESFKELINNDRLIGPTFSGQGCSQSVGSDVYGFYILDIQHIRRGKFIVSLAAADTQFIDGWTDGQMACSIDLTKAEPNVYITNYGTDPITCTSQWYLCDKNGKRFNGHKCNYNWNGAYAYRSPSF